MSTTIDERVVSMEFDNKHFERNAQTTISTLDKLKQKLDFKGMSNSLSTVGEASKTTASSMEELEYASYKASFSWKDVLTKMASTVEWRMAEGAVNAVSNALKNLASNIIGLPSIKAGLSEYETQMGAIQTILANTESKGTTLDDVNSALDELNTYADKTIYNFTQMTRNIGTFTAAGVDLDTSVSAIKGIANLAAVSGSTSEQASTAMYQLSQALASGTVKLMDWNSVVNAGMGGQVFQDALKETAKVHGVAIDQIIENNGSFRESLQEGWLTSEILTETLAKFTGDLSEEQLRSQGYTEQQIADIMKLGQTANDAATKVKTFTQLIDTLKESSQSGWAQTFEILIGDFEEAKELWTNVSNTLGEMIGGSAERRNTLLTGALKSGWDQFIGNGIFDEEGYTYQLKEVAKKHGVSIDEMIKKEGSLQAALRKGFEDETISSDMLIESLGNLAFAYDNCTEKELEAQGVTREQVEELKKLHEAYKKGEISIDEYVNKMTRLSGRELIVQSLANTWQALLKIFTPIKEAFREIFPPKTSEQLYNMLQGFEKFTRKLIISDETADKLKRTFKGLFAAIDIILTVFKSVIKAVGKVLGCLKGLGGGILSVTAGLGDMLVRFRDTIKSFKGIEQFGENVAKVLQKVINTFKNFFGVAKDRIDTSGFNGFLDFLKVLWNTVKNVFGKIIDIFGTVGSALFSAFDGTGLNTIVDLLNAGLLYGIFKGVKNLLGSVSDITESFQGILDGVGDSLQAFQSKLKAEALKSIAISIAILAGSILLLSLMDETKLEKSLAAITLLSGGLMASLSLMGKMKGTAISALQMVGLASSLLILAGALTKIGKLDGDAIKRGIISMAGSLGVLLVAMQVLNKMQGRYILDKKGNIVADYSMYKQLFKLATIMYVVGGALKLLATLSWDDIGRSLTAMAGALTALVGSMYVLSKINKTDANMAVEGAGQIFVLSLSLIPLAIALRMLSKMSWEGIGKGLAVMGVALVGLVTALYVINKIDGLTGKFKKGDSTKIVLGKAAQLALLAIAIGTLAVSLAIISRISWEGILKGLIAMTATLGVLIYAVKLLGKIDASGGKLAAIGATILILTVAIKMLVPTLIILGQLNWTMIGKGIVGLIGILGSLSLAMILLGKVKSSGSKMAALAASLLILSVAIQMLTPTLMVLGSMKLETICKGLLAIAGVLAIFGIATNLLAPAVPAMLGFAGAIALLGVACLAAGAGLALMAHALTLITDNIGNAIKNLCQAIIDSASLIGKAAAALVVGLIDGLVDMVGPLVSGILEIILESLSSLAKFTPQIVSALMDLIIGVGNELINYIPEIVNLVFNLLDKLVSAVAERLSQLNPDALLKVVTAVGVMAILMKVLAGCWKLLPQAMLGLGAVGVLLIELGAILAAMGWIMQKVDTKYINKAGDIMEAIGDAFGRMIGAFAGGVASAFSKSLPEIGKNISKFMENLKPFLDGVNNLDGDILKNTAKLVGSLLLIIGASVIDAITGWITGGTNMVKFAADMIIFGEAIKGFSEKVKGIDKNAVTVASDAGLALAKMASEIPTSGGLWQMLAGGRSLTKFSIEILAFGLGLKGFAKTISGVDLSGVETAANAGLKLAEVASKIPTSGGLWQLIAGGQSLTKFGIEIVAFGAGLQGFAHIISGLDTSGVETAANAGLKLAEVASKIPTSGGLWQLIAGGQSLATFGLEVASFGAALKLFVKGIENVPLEKVEPAAQAGLKLAEIASKIPTSGGIWQLIAGGQSLATFSLEIASYGAGLKSFVESIKDADLTKVEPASNAGLTLAKMASQIPTTGGLWQWIAGGKSLATFSFEISSFGKGLKSFINSVSGLDMNAVVPATEAGLNLAKMASSIPTSGGIWQCIAGGKSLSNFAMEVGSFGSGLKSFVNATGTLDYGNVANSTKAGETLAKMASKIPNSGLFGESTINMLHFSVQIKAFGAGLKSFAESTADLSFDKVGPAVEAGKKLAEMSAAIPSGGIFNTGTLDMLTFKTQIGLFASGITNFVSKLGDTKFSEHHVKAAEIGLKLANIAAKLPSAKNLNISSFGEGLKTLGSGIKNFAGKVGGIDIASLGGIVDGLKGVIAKIKTLVSGGIQSTINIVKDSGSKLSEAISTMVSSAVNIGTLLSNSLKFQAVGIRLVTSFANGIKVATESAKQAVNDLISVCIATIESDSLYDAFYGAGSDAAQGYINGIKSKQNIARAAGSSIGRAALIALKAALRINSPSKEFEQAGEFSGGAYVNKLWSYESDSYDAGYNMGRGAIKGLQKMISGISSLVEDDIDTQPTITPVLDLSQATAGVNKLNGMFNLSPSVGMLSRIDGISSSMNIQNGGNDDVVSAIYDLKDSMGNNSGDTYNINGITYDNGSELQAAIETIIRAARIERRV